MKSSGPDIAGLPDTVLGIVTARVDLLPSAEKELLRDAAVMGGVVWSDGLRAVSERGDEVEELLRSLGRKEFLRRERHSAVAGATQHAFVHALVRDAVYGQLPRRERVDRHVRVARWIESLPEDRREDRAELLSHHYVEAIGLARTAGLDVTELEPKAAHALREAGARAFAMGAYPAVVRALRTAGALPDGLDAHSLRALGKALVLTEQAGEDELQQAFDGLLAEGAQLEASATAMDLAHSAWQHGDGPTNRMWVDRALELVAEAPATEVHAQVLAQAARFMMLAGSTKDALLVADQAIQLSAETGAEGPRASALITRATARANVGVYEGVRDDLEKARILALQHDPSEVGRVYTNLNSVLLDLGELEGAATAAREGVAHNERSGTIGGSGGFIYGNLAETLFLCGDWDEAAEIARRELERAKRTGGLYHEPLLVYVLSELALVRDGGVDEAIAAAHRVLELARRRGDAQVLTPSLALAAWRFVRTGKEEEGGACLDELLEYRRANPRGFPPGSWCTFAAFALDRIGRRGELALLEEPPGSTFLAAALEVDSGRFEDAARILETTGARQLEGEARLLAARELRRAGDESAAETHLTRARELFDGMGATARLRELDSARSV